MGFADAMGVELVISHISKKGADEGKIKRKHKILKGNRSI
jgi:hypothetical protein